MANTTRNAQRNAQHNARLQLAYAKRIHAARTAALRAPPVGFRVYDRNAGFVAGITLFQGKPRLTYAMQDGAKVWQTRDSAQRFITFWREFGCDVAACEIRDQ